MKMPRLCLTDFKASNLHSRAKLKTQTEVVIAVWIRKNRRKKQRMIDIKKMIKKWQRHKHKFKQGAHEVTIQEAHGAVALSTAGTPGML